MPCPFDVHSTACISLRTLAGTSPAQKLPPVPLAPPQSPAVRCSGSAPHLLPAFPNGLAHGASNTQIRQLVCSRPLAYADPSAGNVQPSSKSRLKATCFEEPSPGPPRPLLCVLCPIPATPFVLALEADSLGACLLLPSPPRGELTGPRLNLVYFYMSKGSLPRQVPTSVCGYWIAPGGGEQGTRGSI